ncbi:hypothetical protein FALBO_15260 [Fusarium albosuccineum]|uniref:Zn(2)-C6 fungal-type domain-containing protein n=1 Tax=Fusarium albosuccineum TaxID=1237068 RepID=A0A8H4KWY5_9HYPO|nr:hypothetical protein FALBO_15260 [Fusarium albosuccineum]
MSDSKATRNRKAQAILIETTGHLIMPCGYCEPRKLRCWAKEGHKNCAQCTRRGRKCDGKGVTLVEADKFAAEKRRLEKEEEVAETELINLQQQVNERLGRLMRLRRQKRHLQERAEEMLRRNVETLDELEALENEESFAAVEAQSLGAVDVIDWSSLGLEISDVLPSLDLGESSSGVVGRS